MGDNNNKKNTGRFIGKIQELSSDSGQYYQIWLDNVNPQNSDGSSNQYYKGNLVWFDQETGKRYIVKRLALRKPSEAQANKGATNSIMIDLENSYYVDELE